jgi:predicted flap endonuclease-1-like 5' DNA nuclease
MSGSVLVALIVGIAVGLVIAYVYFWRRWRPHYESQIRTLQLLIMEKDPSIARLEPNVADRDRPIGALQAEMAQRDPSISLPEDLLQDGGQELQELEPRTAQPVRDDLKVIRGIGVVYEGLLHAGGIWTYKELSEATPEQVRGIVDVPEWRRIQPESWIEQARELAN